MEILQAVNTDVISREDWEKIIRYLDSIQFGTVTLVVQNGKVVQVEKTEKIKLK